MHKINIYFMPKDNKEHAHYAYTKHAAQTMNTAQTHTMYKTEQARHMCIYDLSFIF